MKCQRDSVYDKGERDRDQREISERERDGRERERAIAMGMFYIIIADKILTCNYWSWMMQTGSSHYMMKYFVIVNKAFMFVVCFKEKLFGKESKSVQKVWRVSPESHRHNARR